MASLARPITSRAVHLRITPRPSNLGESREILRLITEFGEVEYFKNLKYDSLSAPNTALVIFKDESAAQNCLRRSPVRFRMGRAETVQGEARGHGEEGKEAEDMGERPVQPLQTARGTGGGGAWGLSQQSRSMSTHSTASYTPIGGIPSRPVQQPFQPPPLPILDDSRIFQIQTNPARAHFRDQINMGHYHGSFAIDTKSIAQKELRDVVPPAMVGLSCVDWRKGDKAWRLVKREKERERQGMGRRRSLKELWEGHEAGGEGGEGYGFRDEALPG